jgi:hypothetical protein
LVIKHNDHIVDGNCRACGMRTQAAPGPELFVEGTWDLICRDCGRDRDPALVALLALSNAINESLQHLGKPNKPGAGR